MPDGSVTMTGGVLRETKAGGAAPLVSLVVPCFNEEEVLPLFPTETLPVLHAMPGARFEFVFVNDGSADGTLPFLVAQAGSEPDGRVIDLSRNFGKEAALSAGLAEARGDVVIPFDADLQDPPDLIPALVERCGRGSRWSSRGAPTGRATAS